MDETKFFRSAAAFRKWLHANHARAGELWVGYYRKGSGRPGMTYPESVDEALCYGWIDGIRKSIDDTSYRNRFTPRRATSVWSAVNTARVAELTKAGRMHASGLAAFEGRDPRKSGIYTFERRDIALDAAMQKEFEAAKEAWAFFTAQPPYYRKLAIGWITAAKKEETRQRRLRTLIDDSAAGLRLAQFRRP